MRWAKIDENGNIVQYPYDVPAQLKKDYPSTFFNKRILPEDIVELNIVPVLENYPEMEAFEDPNFNLVLSTTPEKGVDGNWYLNHQKIEKTEEERLQFIKQKEDAIKIFIGTQLSGTDWMVIREIETGTPMPEEVKTYRQEMVNLQNHLNFPFLNEEDIPQPPEGYTQLGNFGRIP